MLVCGVARSKPSARRPAASSCALAILQESGEVVERDQAGRAQDAPLSDPAAQHLAQTARREHRLPASADDSKPTGAPNPLLRQTCTVSTPRVSAVRVHPSAAAACQEPRSVEVDEQARRVRRLDEGGVGVGARRHTVPPAALWVFSRQSNLARKVK